MPHKNDKCEGYDGWKLLDLHNFHVKVHLWKNVLKVKFQEKTYNVRRWNNNLYK